MPSFADSIFLFVLALLLFGPKKLPVLARELGKWMGEFRRASNEFKMQMEEELRVSEQADRQKQIAAMEAAAPLPPPTEAEAASEVHPHERGNLPSPEPTPLPPEASAEAAPPLPIASSGELQMMPPSTGLPSPRSRSGALGSFVESIPEMPPAAAGVRDTESLAHGD